MPQSKRNQVTFQTPGVGNYDLLRYYNKNKENFPSSFKKQKSQKININIEVGPGSYNTNFSSFQIKGNTMNKAKKHMKAEVTPGPGYYKSTLKEDDKKGFSFKKFAKELKE